MNFFEPGHGIHAYRIADIAIIDVLLTLIVAYVISFYVNYSFLIIAILLFILSIIVHHALGIRTTVDKLIFSK